MKYIFTIHSPITFFCAANVIKYENLASEDVIFLYTNYRPPEGLGKIVKTFHDKNQSTLAKIKTFNLVKHYDNYLSSITEGDSFLAYIDLVHYYQRILITHSNCVGINFIEEGTASYIAPNSLHYLTFIEAKTQFRFNTIKERVRAIRRILRGFNLKSLALPYSPGAYSFIPNSKFYGFSSLTFPGVPENKKVILLPDKLDSKKEYSIYDNSLILIEDSYFRVFKIKEEVTDNTIDLSLSILDNDLKNRKVFIKLRPNQKEIDSLWGIALKRNAIPYKIIPSTMILEEVLIYAKQCKLVGTVSSLLLYGSIFGHETLSNYDQIRDKPITVFDELEFYWDKVKLLNKDYE
ncbi:MAG: polysialyltransferase family glycosyltransferase [Phaeodactylibacter sp.]|uniref:polysialyltransferase family glycosyltransferase n=1 Tax=Phaeodactylibacter sp. TaxID=1940289 RepID=UPI0032EF72C8